MIIAPGPGGERPKQTSWRGLRRRGGPRVGAWDFDGPNRVVVHASPVPLMQLPDETRVSNPTGAVAYKYMVTSGNVGWGRRNFQMAQQATRMDMFAGFDEFMVHQHVELKGYWAFELPGAGTGGWVPADQFSSYVSFGPMASQTTPSSVSMFYIGGVNYIGPAGAHIHQRGFKVNTGVFTGGVNADWYGTWQANQSETDAPLMAVGPRESVVACQGCGVTEDVLHGDWKIQPDDPSAAWHQCQECLSTVTIFNHDHHNEEVQHVRNIALGSQIGLEMKHVDPIEAATPHD